jgi:hypothetical protein
MGGGPAACALVELAPFKVFRHCLGRSRLSREKNPVVGVFNCCSSVLLMMHGG